MGWLENNYYIFTKDTEITNTSIQGIGICCLE